MHRPSARRLAAWVAAALMASASSAAAQSSGPAPAATPSAQPAAPPSAASSPLQAAHAAERERILRALKIPALPPGASGSRAETYDEAAADPFPTLPDPLLFDNGAAVDSPGAWRGRRRAEILEHFEREVYGRRPVTIPAVTWRVAGTSQGSEGGIATRTTNLLGVVDNARHPALSVVIQAVLTTPAGAAGPVPIVVQLGGGSVPLPEGLTPTTNPCLPPGGLRPPAAGGRGAEGAGRPPPPTWQQQILERGWGYAVVNPSSIQGDCGAGLTAGIIGLVNEGRPRALDDWGALSAWAWGAGRLLDYLHTDRTVDASRVGVTGHSRYGKAALVAMALDERFAIAFISSSGHGGAKLHRRKYGERVENVASAFYHWMAGNYLKYAGNWDALPVDAHELIALCAPRPVFLSAGRGPDPARPDGTVVPHDAWVDPRGSFLAAAAAGPVYRLLGVKDLGTMDYPPIGEAVTAGDLAFHQHTGGHTPGPSWPVFLRFASRYLDRQTAPSALRQGDAAPED